MKEVRSQESGVRITRAAVWVLAGATAFAQRPSNPALLVPQEAPAMDYAAVPDPLPVPANVNMGASSSVAFDSKGHLFVLSRGAQPITEFDENGKFIRSFGEGLFTRSHGLRIAADGSIWVTDVGAHTVMKLSPRGEVLLTLGEKGKAGAWNESTHLLNEPNDIAIAANGDLFVTQGHTPGPGRGDPRVLKFDKNGNFIKSWGGKGTDPGKFDVAHGLAIDAKGLLWVTDRENQRIQVFDQDGTFIRQIKYAGLPCALDIGPKYIYMVNGFAGQLLRLDLDGNVLAAVGKVGNGVGEFGEAHFVAVSSKGDIYVADSVNRAVQKFVKK
ncbi:MAG TPA: peptidyl-alpha-hydroxyglycine alpha-amidating lyase family protein [Bryobacteraceae bacterium]